MSSTALVPMVCYRHPNGQRSNIKHPNILCGSEQHTIMLICGYLLLALGLLAGISSVEAKATLELRCVRLLLLLRLDGLHVPQVQQ